MSYIHEKTITIRTVVTKVESPFMTYKQFSVSRKDKPCCDFCDEAFKPTDTVHLGFVKTGLNVLLCDKCAHTAIENGADKVKMFGKLYESLSKHQS